MYYKELEVWKEARVLVKAVYILTEKLPKTEIFGLISQIRRCVISIPSNIAEGCSRRSDKDTNRFIDIAICSLAELDTQLILAEDLGYINYNADIINLVNKINALLRGLKNYVSLANDKNLST